MFGAVLYDRYRVCWCLPGLIAHIERDPGAVLAQKFRGAWSSADCGHFFLSGKSMKGNLGGGAKQQLEVPRSPGPSVEPRLTQSTRV